VKLRVLAKERHTVAAYVKERIDDHGNVTKQECRYYDQRESLCATNRKHEQDCTKVQQTMDRYAASGFVRLPSDQLKSVTSPQNDIYEFKRGRVRAYCFIDEESVIVVTCCLLKKDKPDKKEIEHARKVKTEYFSAKAADNIEYI